MIPDMRLIKECETTSEVLTVGDLKKVLNEYDDDCPILDYDNPSICHLFAIYQGTEHDAVFLNFVVDEELVEQVLEERKGE